MSRTQRWRVRFWWNLYLWLPESAVREFAWRRWMQAYWVKPAVPVRGRRIDQPSDETGVE